jgi:nucleotide-binding universal stress UspA family protein
VNAPSNSGRPTGRIVVGVDGSPASELALRWAAGQARLTGQVVEAVASWDFPSPYDRSMTGEFEWSEEASGALAKTVENVLGAADAGRVVQRVTPGRAAEVLIDASRDADLLVVGPHGHGGFLGLPLGSVSQHVLPHAACPVAVVREQHAGSGRIVVGVDGSPEAQAALGWAARQAALTGGALHALTAWTIRAGYGFVGGAEPDGAARALNVLGRSVAAELGETAGSTAVVEEVDTGHPAEVLLRAAAEADLLVVGCRGRGAFTGLLLGSVSRHVAAHAPCTVVVHHGHSDPHPAP